MPPRHTLRPPAHKCRHIHTQHPERSTPTPPTQRCGRHHTLSTQDMLRQTHPLGAPPTQTQTQTTTHWSQSQTQTPAVHTPHLQAHTRQPVRLLIFEPGCSSRGSSTTPFMYRIEPYNADVDKCCPHMGQKPRHTPVLPLGHSFPGQAAPSPEEQIQIKKSHPEHQSQPNLTVSLL